MWTVNELFYGAEPAHTFHYSYPKPQDVEVKEQHVKEKQKGHHGDLLLRVDMCCEACVKKVRRVLIELNGVNSISVNQITKKVIVTGDVKPDACLKALAKIRKRAFLWADSNEGGGGKDAKKNKNKNKKMISQRTVSSFCVNDYESTPY